MSEIQNNRWISLINWNDFYKLNESVSYESDNEEEVKNFDINLIDFSLNNEKILNEINKILLNDKYQKYTALEILKKQDLVSSYISKSIQNLIIFRIPLPTRHVPLAGRICRFGSVWCT